MRSIKFKPSWFSLSCSLIGVSVLCLAPQSAYGVWQDKADETSSRREVATIQLIEQAGGKVYKISAADESREISFYLSDKPIGDEQLHDINAIREVIWVNLAGTKISNDGLKSLVGLPLKKLHLERTKIGDDGLQHLKSFKDLEYLNLYGTTVTDAGLVHLQDLKNLKRLFVWQTGVTEDGMKKLKDSIPGLEIVAEVKLTPVVIEEPKDATTEEAKTDEAQAEETKTDEKKAAAEGNKEPEKQDDKKEPADGKKTESGRNDK